MTIKMSVKIETEISDKQISGILCTAFEGGANYWYTGLDYELPEGVSIDEFGEGGSRQTKGDYWHWCQLIPLVDEEGFALTLRDKLDEDDKNDSPYRITRESIEKGMKIFAAEYPQHFSDFINQNDDAITGDVFLQCVVFGEAIYG